MSSTDHDVPPTQRLYWEDPHQVRLEAAEVIALGSYGGLPSIVLDRTVFYPESGGQMADAGTLGGHAVADVQVDDAGVIHHVLAQGAPPLEVGAQVALLVDVTRRREHMALHTAQHLLSRALVDFAGAETVSSRLGESLCTIDVDRADVSEAKLAQAAAWVDAAIESDLVVRAWMPEPEELATLALRRTPKQKSGIRIVDIGGLDLSPCGGTHVTRTAQIGLLSVHGTERYKGGTRVSFSAGRRARAELRDARAVLTSLSRTLSAPFAELPAALERLTATLDDARSEAGAMRGLVANAIVNAALREGPSEDGVLRVEVPAGGTELVRRVAAELTREGGRVVLVRGPNDKGVHVVAARGPDSDVDVRPILKACLEANGGRGGGRAERAEGSHPIVIA